MRLSIIWKWAFERYFDKSEQNIVYIFDVPEWEEIEETINILQI